MPNPLKGLGIFILKPTAPSPLQSQSRLSNHPGHFALQEEL